MQLDTSETPSAWLKKALARRTELRKLGPAIMADLKRWLPSSWPLTEASVKDMIETALRALEQGIGKMREIAGTEK